MKRVFIIHGWGGSPKSNWTPWLKAQLEGRGFEVHAPQMPDTENPKIGAWVGLLRDLVANPDDDTYLVGHSLGCQAILRFLESLEGEIIVGGTLFVAGFVTIRKEAMIGDTKAVLTPWVNSRIDLQKARVHSKMFVSIFSENDPYIPLSDSDIFREGLGSKIIVIPKGGHLTGSDGYAELHAALNELLKTAT